MSNKKDGTGYKRPPAENRFKPGKSGNPGGRPRKAPPSKSSNEVTVLQYIFAETVNVDGQEMNKLELLVRTNYSRAMKGEPSAIRFITRIIDKFPVADVSRAGGVLVVPGTMPFDEWSAKAAEQQAKFREKDYGRPPEENKEEKKGET
nr:DUF5681 domain-containing protein [uncultured Sphingorhabdus sp.]